MPRSPRSGRRRLSVLLTGAVLAVSGCSTTPADNAARTLPPPPEPVPLPPAQSLQLPPRPHEIPLDSVDPCALLSPAQRSQLGLDRGPTPGSEAGFGNAATCDYRNTRANVATRVALVTIEGVDVWTSDTAQVHATPTTVAGFPALVVRTPGLELACNVAIDVARGQHIDVLYRDDGAEPPVSRDQLCAGAARVAEAVVTGLTEAPPRGTNPPRGHPSRSRHSPR